MARSRFASDRGVVMLLAVAALAGGCRLFVDLDGLGDGPEPVDASTDGIALPDVTAPPQDSAVDSPIVDNPDVGPPPPDGGCANKGGPAPVRVEAGAVTYCIDSSEVTREQYGAFLATSPSTAGQPPQCAWNTTFVPTDEWPYLPATKDYPVVGVDWCDAYAFCAWAGKRLCGAIGVATFGDREDPGKSEWVHACSGGGTRTYSSGNVWDPNACNTNEDPVANLTAVKAFPGCQGGFPGLYDMTGSIHEWTGFCGPQADDAGVPTTLCGVSLSAFTHPQGESNCTQMYEGTITDKNNEVGFRCCAP